MFENRLMGSGSFQVGFPNTDELGIPFITGIAHAFQQQAAVHGMLYLEIPDLLMVIRKSV